MKNLISFLILTLFCGQSNSEIDCNNKFQKVTTFIFNPFEVKPIELAKHLCKSLKYGFFETSLGLYEKEANKRWNECVKQHLPYFEEIKVDKNSIENYGSFCYNFKLPRSCQFSENSINLLKHLRPYCWTLDDIAKADESIFNPELRITPEDWKDLNDIKCLKLPLCFDQISSDVVNKPTTENNNLATLKNFIQNFSGVSVFQCDCIEIIGLKSIFDNLDASDQSKHQNLYRDVCLNENKKYSWRKVHLDVISEFKNKSQEFSNYRKVIVDFLVTGGTLGVRGWFTEHLENSKWSLKYILENSLIDKTNIDHKRIDMMAKAIYFGYSMELFDQFLDLTSSIGNDANKIDIWQCRKYIIDAFFEYDRISRISRFLTINEDNLNYSSDIKYANRHLKLFLQLQPQTSCKEFASEVDNIVNIFYSYVSKLDGEDLSQLLKSAVKHGKSLINVYKCLSFTNFIENEVISKDLLKKQDGMDGKHLQSHIDTNISEFRRKFFDAKENFSLCETEAPKLSTFNSNDSQSTENIIKLFKQVFGITKEVTSLDLLFTTTQKY